MGSIIKRPGIVNLIDKVSKYFTVIVVLIALIGLMFWLINGDVRTAIFSFTAVLIVACPCALALSIPFTFGNAMRLFGNAGFYIKNTGVIERLTKIDTIVFDKTGTITKPDENSIRFIGEELSHQEKSSIKSLTKQSTHPYSSAISKFYQDFDYVEPKQFIEMPGRGIHGEIGDMDIRIGSESCVNNIKLNTKKDTTVVYLSKNEEIRGFWKIMNKYRDGFDSLLYDLKNKFDLYLLSGDNDSEKDNLINYFNKEKLIFNQQPHDKKDFIEKLQKQGKTVLMTGDGLNDAGALIQSDVALTIADNVYHFSPAGDAILEANKFSKLSNFIKFTDTSLRIVKMSFAISFLYNIVGMSFAIAGNLSPVIAAILMPISSISVVAFATFATQFYGRRINKAAK